MQSAQGIFTASDNAIINFDIGFHPTYIELISAIGSTELIHRFYRVLADAEATGQYGFISNGAGALTPNSSGSGIILYEEGEDVGVLIVHPSSLKKVIASVADWVASTSVVGRTTTAIGTVRRPTKHNGRVYECTTSGTGHTAEPTWPTVIGDTVTEGAGSAIWTCRLEETYKAGGQGFSIEAGIVIDSDKWVFRAVKDDKWEDFGDVQGVNPVRFESNKR